MPETGAWFDLKGRVRGPKNGSGDANRERERIGVRDDGRDPTGANGTAGL
jgi:hypothetical protein